MAGSEKEAEDVENKLGLGLPLLTEIPGAVALPLVFLFHVDDKFMDALTGLFYAHEAFLEYFVEFDPVELNLVAVPCVQSDQFFHFP